MLYDILLPYNTVSMSGAVALCIYGDRERYGIALVGGPSATTKQIDINLDDMGVSYSF